MSTGKRRHHIPEERTDITPNSISSGNDARRKGRDTEERFAEACRTLTNWPSWLVGIRWSNEEEDRRQGVDFWAETKDVGSIPIQVKSSFGGIQKFVRRRPEMSRECLLMIVRSSDPCARIQRLLLVGLAYQRRRRLDGDAKPLSAEGVHVRSIEIIRAR